MNLMIWEMLGFSHQFPIALENAKKPITWGKPGKLVIKLFPQYGYFFPILFSSYGMLHHMGNAWVFPSISHSTGKCSKTYRMEKTWETGNHTFPIVWVLFSHSIPILWYTSSYGKCMGFPINFPQYRKMQQNPSYGEDLGNWYSYFPHSMGAFFRQIPILWYSSLHRKCMGFLINFQQYGKMP